MKPSIRAFVWFVLSSSATACPFGSSGGAPPNDTVHRQRLRHRLSNINIDHHRPEQRELQLEEDCLTEDTYDAIYSDIEAMSAVLADNVSRSHFLGGILRLGEIKTTETHVLLLLRLHSTSTLKHSQRSLQLQPPMTSWTST